MLDKIMFAVQKALDEDNKGEKGGSVGQNIAAFTGVRHRQWPSLAQNTVEDQNSEKENVVTGVETEASA